MSKSAFALAFAAAFSAAAVAGPFDQFKGKMKDGMYEYKMQMEMPGMPAGMGKQNMTFQNCVSQKDIEDGGFGKQNKDKPDNCEVKNFKMSGNTATYTMDCKGEPKMTADNKITFTDAGFDMDMKMAMNQGGQVMNMNQKMQGRYIGPCKK
ncbi:MAG TPA: DUF3617 family protein [Usitatibacter sp.]|nr:DUF3617 family protein [Usitatibacter sp.]